MWEDKKCCSWCSILTLSAHKEIWYVCDVCEHSWYEVMEE